MLVENTTEGGAIRFIEFFERLIASFLQGASQGFIEEVEFVFSRGVFTTE